MDLNLPDYSGADVTAQIKSLLPNISVVILTVYNDADHIFKALRAGADGYLLKQATATQPLTYTRIWDFMSSYGKKRGGTYQQSGHTGYPKDCIFVFDPQFNIFCDNYARQLASTKDDPWLLGHFSDNEMPFKADEIVNCLELPDDDPGHQAALSWLRALVIIWSKIQRSRTSMSRTKRTFWPMSRTVISASFRLRLKSTIRITSFSVRVSMAEN